MNRNDFITLARSYAPTAPADPRYTELLRHPGDPPGWPERYYPDPSTYTCALTVLGLWRLAGVRHALLRDAYRPGHATADMAEVARDAGAYRSVGDLLSVRYRLAEGDAVMIVEAGGDREHAFTVTEAQETEIGWRTVSVDGGHSIHEVRRIWRRGPGRIVVDDGRLVAYVVDWGALMAANAGTDPMPDSAPPGGDHQTSSAPPQNVETIVDSVITTSSQHHPPLRGIDVSQYQDPAALDWPVLARTFGFCIARATYGLKPDPRFVAHIRAARGVGMGVTGYHFLWQDAPAEQQVAAFLAQLDLAGIGEGDIVPAVDLEDDGPRRWDVYVPRARAFCEAMGSVMIYTGPDFYQRMGTPEWVREYPLWVAHYTNASAPAWPWGEWALWQHTTVPVDGSAGKPLDQNRARVLPIRRGGTGYL